MRISEAISLGSSLVPYKIGPEGCVFTMALAAVGSKNRRASAVNAWWPWLFDFQISEDICGCQLGRTSLYLQVVHLSDYHVNRDWSISKVAEHLAKIENELIYLVTRTKPGRVRYSDFIRKNRLSHDQVSVLQDAVHADESLQVRELKRMVKLS